MQKKAQKKLHEKFVLVAVSLFVVIGSALALSSFAQHGTVLGKAVVGRPAVKKAPAKKVPPKAAPKKVAPKKAPAKPAAAAKPAAPQPPLPAIPVGTAMHDADFPLACGSYRETLVASDYTTPGVNGGTMADQKRKSCIRRLIKQFMYDWNDNRYPEYPEGQLEKLFGVRPQVEKLGSGNIRYVYYFKGNAILGPYGDAFSETQPCYSFDLKDYRKNAGGKQYWSFGDLQGPDVKYCK
ncbi:MAG: hypothetical protein Q7S89_01395 [bacterium]|nr:hypothetical protein [bacterium]